MKKLQTVALIWNTKNPFGVLESFTKGLAKAFLRAGLSCYTIDIQNETESAIRKKFAAQPPDCTVGFNITIAPDIFFNDLRIPHLSIIVDSAARFMELKEFHNCMAGFVDEDSCQLMTYLGKKNVLYIPHAIDKEIIQSTSQKRDLDLVMTGAFFDIDEVFDNLKIVLSETSLKIVRNLIEQVLASPTLSHIPAFLKELQDNQPFREELFNKGINPPVILNALETFFRGLDRLRFLKAIEVCDIHIYGEKDDMSRWKKALPDKKRIQYHGPIPYIQLPELFSRTKIVLNSVPWIKYGLHERALTAFARGASVLGNATHTLSEQFPDAYMGVTSPDYDKANELIQKALANEPEREKAVLATHEHLLKKHTWDERASLLIDELPILIEEII